MNSVNNEATIERSFIVLLKEFVNWLAGVIESSNQKRINEDMAFKAEYEKLQAESGHKPDPKQLAKEMAYVLMNKIVFYKVLERHHEDLKLLRPITAPDDETYLAALNDHFSNAVELTGNFEAVFNTGIYDRIELPSKPEVFDKINDFIEELDKHKIEELGSDVVGYIYEELIPAHERHALGQFYTPPAIAEMITNWAVRNPDDKVLDPGCGSGAFLIKAYNRILELKGKSSADESTHEQILRQIYAIDINPFPLHLSALNLAVRHIKAPLMELNTIQADFFTIGQDQDRSELHVVKTPVGEIKREIQIPQFDAIIANPPYTRWTEIPEKTRIAIKESVGASLKEYGLTAQVQRGLEPAIYIHFIMHGLSMLKEGGRLGMIISDSWLQTDYGIDFGHFLLEHFKIITIVDLSAKIFPVPLVGSCIILLEKCVNDKERDTNRTVFMYADLKEGDTFESLKILDLIEHPDNIDERFLIKTMKQDEITPKQKWINLFFNADIVLKKLKSHTIKMGDLFEPSYGNATYLYLASRGKVKGPRNLGTKNFYYLKENDVKTLGLKEYVFPALTSVRYAKWFTFKSKDWLSLKERGAPCFFFMCHEPRNNLPSSVQEYITWGETECRTSIRGSRGGGKVCSQALACQAREKAKKFFKGWYDLGGVERAPIIAVYQAQYKTRFILVEHSIVTYHAALNFIPKVDLDTNHLKALLAYLNSSFSQLFIESRARITGMGVAALEVRHAEELPIIDINKLDQKEVDLLSSLFDKLEAKARKIGGADKFQNIELLWEMLIEKIDEEISRILNLPKNLEKEAKKLARVMMSRRLERARRGKPLVDTRKT